MIQVNQLHIYPVKSMQGIALNESEVLSRGLQHDRLFMVTYPDGRFLTAREHPNLLKLRPRLNDSSLTIALDDKTITVNFTDFSDSHEPTEVWGNNFTSHIGPISVNRFLSEFLQVDAQLRWIGPLPTRRIRRYPDIPLSFADGYPFLLLNQSSFNYLQQQCSEKLDIRQFRGNIIIDNALPFAEDGWKTIKIGDVIFDLVKPCARCILITVNADTAIHLNHQEPLQTLRYFRQDEQGAIDFGINMIARNQGTIHRGDPVEVLEKQRAKNYLKTFPRRNPAEEKSCKITINGQTFIGNNYQPILEQFEQHNIALPNSCRSGVCGRCRATLEQGEVSAMTQSALLRNNRILTCSCIPKSDIVLSVKNHKN